MLNSVGRPFSQTKVIVSDSKITITGPSVSAFNHKQADKKNKTFKTSDTGVLKKGFLFIKGRTDDIIISSGENISLAYIRNILLNHKNIVDLHLTHEKNNQYGTKIIIYIELNNNKINKDDIMNYCKKYLSKAQCPHDIQIVEKINHG
jgi:acyl-CoA synthetase (AMP-forming)/AMP-acid ligase II